MTPLVRRGPVVLLTDVPDVAETPAQHVRNALIVLGRMCQMHPFIPAFHPEVGRAQRRAEAAVIMLEHHAARHFVLPHVEGAIHALLESDLPRDLLPELTAATARLFRSLFAIHQQ